MKITSRAIAYLKGSPPLENNQYVTLSLRDDPVLRPYLEELHVCYLADNGQSYSYIQNRHLEEDGINADELHQIGLQNLARLVALRDSIVKKQGNVYAVLIDGVFEASVVLLNDFWEDEARRFINGDYAVTIPSRDVLAFCDNNSERGISELYELIDRVWQTNDHLVSQKIYIRNGNKWTTRKS